MRKSILFSLMICLAGYCWGQMTPQYDSYVTYSADSNNNFYQTIVVEGTTTGSCNTTCCQGSPYPPYYTCWSCPIQGCSTAVHTGTITNVVNGVGGTTTSPSYNPFSYMSYQTTTSVLIPPGGQVSNSCGTSVSCSVAGQFFASSSCFTPSSHTYPNSPLTTNCQVRTPFDAIINTTTKAIHAAQDIGNTTHDLQVGAPVYAPEAGTVHIQGGYPHVNQPVTQCAGQGYHANYINITDGSGNRTRLVHVTALPSLAEGQQVNAGQQVGTVDLSGCTSGPHVHMSRKQAGKIVNFTIPCDNSHFDSSGFYDDSDGLDNQ